MTWNYMAGISQSTLDGKLLGKKTDGFCNDVLFLLRQLRLLVIKTRTFPVFEWKNLSCSQNLPCYLVVCASSPKPGKSQRNNLMLFGFVIFRWIPGRQPQEDNTDKDIEKHKD